MNRKPPPRRLLVVIAYVGFISLGLPDTLIGVAWPSVRETFGLEQGAIALIFFGAAASYAISSFFAGRIVNSVGVGILLSASTALVACSIFGYALAPAWALFAGFSLMHGLGSGAIDAGLNYYVANHMSVRHMSWLHASWSLGATLGPLVMTGAVAWWNDWHAGYFAVAAILSCLMLLFIATRREWDRSADAEVEPPTPHVSARMFDALRHPIVLVQVVLFFVYTGLEATVGHWCFTLLTESRNMPEATAGLWTTLFWWSIGVGRVVFGTIADRVGIDRLLRISTYTALVGTALFALNVVPLVSALGLAVAGLGLASIYPCMMMRTPQRLGQSLAAHAIGFQVSAATLGAAVLPSLSGFLAEQVGLEVVAAGSVGMALIVVLLHEHLLTASRTSPIDREQG